MLGQKYHEGAIPGKKKNISDQMHQKVKAPNDGKNTKRTESHVTFSAFVF